MNKVLVVEDHPDIRKLVRMTLELGDYEVHEAIDAPVGVAAAVQLRPQIVLLDVMMPGAYDGLEACRRIKRDVRLKNTKVVMLSARGQSQDREAGRLAGADIYLVKPFSPLQLIDTVANLCAA